MRCTGSLAETAQNDGSREGALDRVRGADPHAQFVERRTDPDDSEYRLNCAGLDADQQQDETHPAAARPPTSAGPGARGRRAARSRSTSSRAAWAPRAHGLSREIRAGSTRPSSPSSSSSSSSACSTGSSTTCSRTPPADAAARAAALARQPPAARRARVGLLRGDEPDGRPLLRRARAVHDGVLAQVPPVPALVLPQHGLRPRPRLPRDAAARPGGATTTRSACPNGPAAAAARARAVTARAYGRAGRRRRQQHPRRRPRCPGSRARRRPARCRSRHAAGQDHPRRGARGREHRGRVPRRGRRRGPAAPARAHAHADARAPRAAARAARAVLQGRRQGAAARGAPAAAGARRRSRSSTGAAPSRSSSTS